MPERKWYKGRPIRRTKAKNGLVKIIFDDGPPGLPGDTVHVREAEYANPDNVRREFFQNDKSAVKQRT